MPGIKVAEVKKAPSVDGYKRYQSTLKDWLSRKAKIKQAKEAAKQSNKK